MLPSNRGNVAYFVLGNHFHGYLPVGLECGGTTSPPH
jgi:hypothetical protein